MSTIDPPKPESDLGSEADPHVPTGTDYVSDRRFADFPVSPDVLKGIADLGYVTATPVQAVTIEPALAGVVASADAAPTQGARGVYGDVAGRVDAQFEGLEAVLVTELGAFNTAVQGAQLPAIVPPEKKW